MRETVQLEMERRKAFAEKYGISKLDYATVNNPFAGRVICGSCGSPFGRKVWNSNDERLKRVVWRCNKKYEVKVKKSCNNGHIDDGILYQAFVNTFNAMIENRDYFMEKWKEHLKSNNALIKYKSKQFIEILKNAKPIENFDMDLFFSIIEKMTLFEGEEIIASLLDGTEIEVVIE